MLSVMLMMALLSTLLIYSAENEDLNIRRLSNIREAEQGFQVSMGGEQWGVKVLEKDLTEDLLKGEEYFDHPLEIWGQLGNAVEVEGTQSSMLVRIEDAQGRINLNNLIQRVPTEEERLAAERARAAAAANGDEEENQEEFVEEIYWYNIFKNLLITLGQDPELADVVADWIDSDDNTRGTTGAEDLYYQGLDDPYRTANRQMSSIAELSLLRGFDANLIAQLAPYVSALPVENANNLTKININTAEPVVISALLAGDADLAANLGSFVELRAVQPFVTVADFVNSINATVAGGVPDGLSNLLDVKSDFYFNHSCAETGRVKLSQSSLLLKQRGQENVKVLSRERYFGCPNLDTGNSEETDTEAEAEQRSAEENSDA